MPMKIAIIGTGKVACEEYVPFLAGQWDVTLGFYNRTPQTARDVAEKFGGEVFPTLAAAVAWEPTAALVLTAETARFEMGKTLIESGVRKIFFEKPLVAAAGQAHVTEEDFTNAKALLALARARGCETAMVFNYRFFEQTAAAKQAVESRKLGKVIHIAAQVHFACWSHCIDLIHFFAGNVEEITALAGNVSRHSPELGIDANDVAAALRMSNGATGTLIGTTGMKWQHPLYELIFTFENGRIHLRDLDGTTEILDGSANVHETISLVRHTSRWDQYSRSFKQAVGAYLQSLRENRPPPVAGMEGLRELQVEAALKRSIAERRPVRVQEEFALE
ncbi:MAG: Gfo/Idh/MocA family oxidoreductase [Tepidisphaeraceae bacterium]